MAKLYATAPSAARVPSPELPAALLEACGLTAGYRREGGREMLTLRDVSLAVAAGELLGLVGPNGSGKTTLIRAVMGVVRPLAGEVRLAGHDAASLSQRERARRVAVVPQNPILPDAFTGLEVVLMGRTPYLRLLQNEGASDIEAVARAMAATSTSELASRRIGELSGGERQRLVLARALAQDTPLLLLDEPTAHLDVGHQASVLELMRCLCREQNRGVLAVVHDLTLAAQYCDRLVMLDRGAIVVEGDPVNVLSPNILRQVYGARAAVFPHPDTGRPVVAPSPDGG